jgi:hypothetical protein
LLKKTLTYENFNEEEVKEDFFFHLSQAELVELELNHTGGMSAALQRIIDAEDGAGIVEEIKTIITMAYGVRSLDGKKFIKNEELIKDFRSTGAYDALFMELVMDSDKALQFVRGIMPRGMVEQAEKLAGTETANAPNLPELVELRTTEPRIVTRDELVSMPIEEFQQVQEQIKSGDVQVSE